MPATVDLLAFVLNKFLKQSRQVRCTLLNVLSNTFTFHDNHLNNAATSRKKKQLIPKLKNFPWDFFITISTHPENHESDDFQRCSDTNKKLWTNQSGPAKMKISDFGLFSKIKIKIFIFLS